MTAADVSPARHSAGSPRAAEPPTSPLPPVPPTVTAEDAGPGPSHGSKQADRRQGTEAAVEISREASLGNRNSRRSRSRSRSPRARQKHKHKSKSKHRHKHSHKHASKEHNGRSAGHHSNGRERERRHDSGHRHHRRSPQRAASPGARQQGRQGERERQHNRSGRRRSRSAWRSRSGSPVLGSGAQRYAQPAAGVAGGTRPEPATAALDGRQGSPESPAPKRRRSSGPHSPTAAAAAPHSSPSSGTLAHPASTAVQEPGEATVAEQPEQPEQAGQADEPTAVQLPADAKHRVRRRHSSPGGAAGRAEPVAAGGGEVARGRLSFGDELEEEDEQEDGHTFSLAASTARRFQKERGLVLHPARQPAGLSGLGGPPGELPLRTLGQLVIAATQARGARPYQEDRHTILHSFTPHGSAGQPLPDGVHRSFAAVFDGHNGAQAAEQACARLHVLLAAEPALRTCTGDGPPASAAAEEAAVSAALRRAFHAMDGEILARCRAEDGRDGATGLVLLRIGDWLYTAHCGDSRAVLARDGAAVALTEDHKPNLPLERARVREAGGRVDWQRCWRIISDGRPGRPASGLAVSRSFGDLDFKEPHRYVECEPDVRCTRLAPGDSFVVLASDGLWDVLSNQQAVDVAAAALAQREAGGGQRGNEARARAASEALVQQALASGTLDNVTALLVLMHWD